MIRAINQKPQSVGPAYSAVPHGQFDPVAYIKETLAKPLYVPLLPNQPVSIEDGGRPVTEDDIVNNVIACCQDVQDPKSEDWCKELFHNTLTYFDRQTNLNVRMLFAIQAACEHNSNNPSSPMPFPSPQVIYTPGSDVIPVSRKFLAGQVDYAGYFATMAFYTRAQTLGFYFANETAFNEFKTWMGQQLPAFANNLDATANQLFQDFQSNISLDGLTESLILRNDDSENNDEYTFARMLTCFLFAYGKVAGGGEFGCLPFDLAELYCPKTVVFVNVEKHAHARANQVNDEWQLIQQSLGMKIKMISNNKLSKLTAAARNLKHIQSVAANIQSNAQQAAQRAATIRFAKKPPNTVDIVKLIKKIMSKMATVAMSENVYKTMKLTYNKPNRRNPDDFNKPGKTVSTKFKPDIHIYVDTSGSISEENYKHAIMACIMMAKKLNVNLYFNSFSHIMSQCTKLNTKDKTVAQLYKEFLKVPKVDGGTDYMQIWQYINKRPKRLRELSIIITDFEYQAPNMFVPHPKNLYYVPCSKMDWTYIRRCARNFLQSMRHIDPDCRRHLLF